MLNKNVIRGLLRKAEAVQVNQLWMRIGKPNFAAKADEVVCRCEPIGTGPQPVEFTWTRLMRSTVKNDELVLEDGTRIKFCRLTPIPIPHGQSTRPY